MRCDSILCCACRYVLEVPATPGPAQDALRILPQARYVLSVKVSGL